MKYFECTDEELLACCNRNPGWNSNKATILPDIPVESLKQLSDTDAGSRYIEYREGNSIYTGVIPVNGKNVTVPYIELNCYFENFDLFTKEDVTDVVELRNGKVLFIISNKYTKCRYAASRGVPPTLFDMNEMGEYVLSNGKRTNQFKYDFLKFMNHNRTLTWTNIYTLFKSGDYEKLNAYYKFQPHPFEGNLRKEGTSKVSPIWLKIYEEVFQKAPLIYAAMCELSVDGNTFSGVKTSQLINAFMQGVETADDLIKNFDGITVSENYWGEGGYFNITDTKIFRTLRKETLKKTGTRAFNKIVADDDGIKIDEKLYPLTSNLIKSGEVKIQTFFTKKEQYFLMNDNWPLWEEMLRRGYQDEIVQIANAASSRTCYEKDLMSYFYFVLYDLPKYLKSHTGGKKWECIPLFVDSPDMLEPVASGVTTKTRSPMTPIVDNEKCTVHVPYAHFRIAGRQTQYCYSLSYNILKEGFVHNGNVCLSEIEENLNGRDDYGLMFYTLTGSDTATGNPTFLIIFEKRTSGVHVHFHRTHPARSKDGDANPVHQWIKTCYNWMVGNVPASSIVNQQGDLVFIREETLPKTFDDEKNLVSQYDNHIFDANIEFVPVSKKENILGYARVLDRVTLNHHEHNAITLDAGTYSVRQCRSFEASPSGIWTLRID
jgi:hypothetical protein